MEAEDIDELIPIFFCFGIGFVTLIMAFMLKFIEKQRFFAYSKVSFPKTQKMQSNFISDTRRNHIEFFKNENYSEFIDSELENQNREYNQETGQSENQNLDRKNSNVAAQNTSNYSLEFIHKQRFPWNYSHFQINNKYNQIKPQIYYETNILNSNNDESTTHEDAYDSYINYLPQSLKNINAKANANYESLYKELKVVMKLKEEHIQENIVKSKDLIEQMNQDVEVQSPQSIVSYFPKTATRNPKIVGSELIKHLNNKPNAPRPNLYEN